MNYLISGSHGFLGSAFDQKHTSSIIHRSSLHSIQELEKVIESTDPDTVIHFAAYGNMTGQAEVKEIVKVNTLYTANLLEAASNKKVKTVVLIGSSSEYGIKNEPMKESDHCEPNTVYGVTKLSSTNLGKLYYNIHNLPVIIVRPFSVYGPKEAPFRFIPTISKQISKGNKVHVCKGNHDWIYIDDFINGLDKVIEKRDLLYGKIVNVGTGVETDNIDIVKRLYRMVNKDENYKEMDRIKSTDSFKWVSDNRLLKSLGWRQETPLDEGLLKTYEYYKTI